MSNLPNDKSIQEALNKLRELDMTVDDLIVGFVKSWINHDAVLTKESCSEIGRCISKTHQTIKHVLDILEGVKENEH